MAKKKGAEKIEEEARKILTQAGGCLEIAILRELLESRFQDKKAVEKFLSTAIEEKEDFHAEAFGARARLCLGEPTLGAFAGEGTRGAPGFPSGEALCDEVVETLEGILDDGCVEVIPLRRRLVKEFREAYRGMTQSQQDDVTACYYEIRRRAEKQDPTLPFVVRKDDLHRRFMCLR
ncbi:MAG: hypothetical protein HQ582_08230 [Planctomycetes bacterium]|nr:hypothetical protein [Planctomycetota bacterium]